MNCVRSFSWEIGAPDDSGALCAMLSTPERERAARLRRNVDRDAFIAAHAGLRKLLARELGMQPAALAFSRGPDGKPQLRADSALHFNLSYRQGWAMCAIGPVPVGVDIERCVALNEWPQLLAQVATVAERDAFEGLPESRREAAFFRLWVRKEAWLKALGIGLSGHPERLSIGCDQWSDASWRALDPGAAAPRWFGRSLPAPAGYVAAIVSASAGASPPPLEHTVLPDSWLTHSTTEWLAQAVHATSRGDADSVRQTSPR